MPQQNLYFIAIIPPTAISQDITAFRNDFKDKYNSKAALKNMPHITLKAPFKIDAVHHNEVLLWFSSLSFPKGKFAVQLRNFGAFPNPNNPVVFVNPVITPQLRSLQTHIIKGFREEYTDIPVHYFEQEFKPHMTIAYRDLEYSEFDKALKDVYCDKEYTAQFEVSAFFLLQHTGTEWKVIADRNLE